MTDTAQLIVRDVISSHSRQNMLFECTQKFWDNYVTKTLPKGEWTSSLLGSVAHNCLEAWYRSAPEGTVPVSGSPLDYFEAEWAKIFEAKGLDYEVYRERLAHSADVLANLYLRASPDYRGADAIRKKGDKKKGESNYPKGHPDYWQNPTSTSPEMTGDWKEALALAGDLDLHNDQINAELQVAFGLDTHGTVNFVEAYSVSKMCVRNYRHPVEIMSIMGIELEFSKRLWDNGHGSKLIGMENQILFGTAVHGNTQYNVWANGKVDMLGIDINGDVWVIDYKSKSKEMHPLEIGNYDQFLTYCKFVELIYGVRPKYVAVYDLRRSRMSHALVDWARVESAYARRKEMAMAGMPERVTPIPREPFGFNSPCFKYNEAKGPSDICPNMAKCHPLLYREFDEVLLSRRAAVLERALSPRQEAAPAPTMTPLEFPKAWE